MGYIKVWLHLGKFYWLEYVKCSFCKSPVDDSPKFEHEWNVVPAVEDSLANWAIATNHKTTFFKLR